MFRQDVAASLLISEARLAPCFSWALRDGHGFDIFRFVLHVDLIVGWSHFGFLVLRRLQSPSI